MTLPATYPAAAPSAKRVKGAKHEASTVHSKPEGAHCTTTPMMAWQVNSLAGLQGACEEAKHVSVTLFDIWVLISQASPLGPAILLLLRLDLQGGFVFVAASARLVGCLPQGLLKCGVLCLLAATGNRQSRQRFSAVASVPPH